MDQQEKGLSEAPSGAEKVLIGIGRKWKLRDNGRDVRQRCLGDQAQEELREACTALWGLIRDRNYCMITTATDGAVYDADLDNRRVIAPRGNVHWKQCSRACTKDVQEEGEMLDDIYPRCKAPPTGDMVDAEIYIEEDYLPRWEAHKKWQTGALNRRLVILELGERSKTLTVMHWPFEEIGFPNRKPMLYRIYETFYQMPKEMGEQAVGI